MRIEVEGLTKRFRGLTALDALRFEVGAGRRVALIGPNGSGKSTLNRVLMGLLTFEGEVRIDGRSPLEERVAIASRMAYVPQSAPQLAAPVRELVQAIGRVRELPRGELGKIAGELGLDLEAVARRSFQSLSGGMKQKLLIALALGSRASLLILDEPTGSLDAASRERFFGMLGSRAPEATLLLCSHRLEEVRHLVDHVLFLHEGRLRYDGPAAAFLEASTRSAVEVRVTGTAAASWLAERGFREGRGGWWARTVEPAEKRALLPELLSSLEGEVADVNVRDLEALELGGVEEGRGRGEG